MQKSYKNNLNTLYIVPTPIGNMKDISTRSIEVLESVSIIACEDTRITGKLLSTLGIKSKMTVFADHNSKDAIEKIKDLLSKGDVALVSDAGTPLISDPGIDLIRVIEKEFNVVAIPGATAFVPALVASGLDTNRFTFIGFLNNKENKRINQLEELKDNKEVIIFYESCHRINKFLDNLHQVFGERKICICRELTKMHEEIHRVSLPYNVETEKGEFCVVVEGNNSKVELNDSDIEKLIEDLKAKDMSNKDIVKTLVKEYSLNKNEVYNLVNKK